MKKNIRLLAVMACFVLLFTALQSGCRKEIAQTPPPDNTPIEQPLKGELPAGFTPLEQRQVAPDFDLPRLDGTGKLSLASLKGKIVLIDFTTTWCGWCTKQEPQVIDLHKKYESKGFTVIAIDCREPRETVMGKYPGGKNLYPVILDEDGNVSGNLYGVTGYPFYLLLDKTGKVAYAQNGYDELMFDKVSKMIDYLMDKEP